MNASDFSEHQDLSVFNLTELLSAIPAVTAKTLREPDFLKSAEIQEGAERVKSEILRRFEGKDRQIAGLKYQLLEQERAIRPARRIGKDGGHVDGQAGEAD